MWLVLPSTPDLIRELVEVEGMPMPAVQAVGAAPTPNQVLEVLASFPEYRVTVRRWDLKRMKGRAIYIKLRRADDSYAISISILLLGVVADDQPVGTFAFEYYRLPEELVRLVGKLAELCGPQVMYHDSGCERPILVTASRPPEPGHEPDGGGR
jgi:hypothetical protein